MIQLPFKLTRPWLFGLIGAAMLGLLGILAAPMVMFAAGSALYATDSSCSSAKGTSTTSQPSASSTASDSIPANYLRLFKTIGAQYHVPWVILAGIGKVESDDGQTTLPGVHSGSNPYGAAGPMQIGIGGASTNVWGGKPVHPASELVDGVATDENHDGIASVYEPADAIAGAAKYLVEHGVRTNVPAAIFAYNHLESYVQEVLGYADQYARGGYVVSRSASSTTSDCVPQSNQVTSAYAIAAITYAEAQIGKPYLYGATGPDAFDCSGLTMMAYRAAGVYIPRTADQQWKWGPRVSLKHVEPGDLVFFAGADGTKSNPGHVGLVIGHDLMIQAPSTGYDVSIATFSPSAVVGFTRPWARSGVKRSAAPAAG